MFKKKHFSVYDDFKTGLLYKIFLSLGLILLLIFVFFKGLSLFLDQESTGLPRLIYDFSHSGIIESIVAFSIIFLGVGIILYFFHCQFVKLAKIADEIENEEEFEDT